LGFLTTPQLTGNNGFLDQILALKWVQANIKRFLICKTAFILFQSSALYIFDSFIYWYTHSHPLYVLCYVLVLEEIPLGSLFSVILQELFLFRSTSLHPTAIKTITFIAQLFRVILSRFKCEMLVSKYCSDFNESDKMLPLCVYCCSHFWHVVVVVVFVFICSLESAISVAQHFAIYVGCDLNDVQCFRQLPLETIMKYQILTITFPKKASELLEGILITTSFFFCFCGKQIYRHFVLNLYVWTV
jgi:hypothetical protein